METEHVIVKRLEIINDLFIYENHIDKYFFPNLKEKLTNLELKLNQFELSFNDIVGKDTHSWNNSCETTGINSHSEGGNTKSIGNSSHSEGNSNYSYGDNSHTEGSNNKSYGISSHVEGISNISNGKSCHVEGICNKGNSDYSHVEGESNISNGIASHSEGSNTQSIGDYSHSSGIQTISEGDASYAGGISSKSIGNYSFTHGFETKTINNNSVSFGDNTISTNTSEFSCGKYNKLNVSDRIFSVGIGEDNDNRNDAISIYLNGIVEMDKLELNNILINGNLIHNNKNDLNYPISIINNQNIISINNTNTTSSDLQDLLKIELINLKPNLLKIKSNKYITTISKLNNIITLNNIEYISLEQLCLKCIRSIQELYTLLP